MQQYDPNFQQSLQAARDEGIAPVYFFYVHAKNRDTNAIEKMGFWSGDEDIPINVETAEGGFESRLYYGGCNLTVEGITYAGDLTDNPVSVGVSQIADAAQQLIRGYDVRLAYCEIHATTMSGGAFTSPPQMQFIGMIDDTPIATPAAGSDGGIEITVRSELMSQLTSINPAKSSDSHQQRRQVGDLFSAYSGIISSQQIQWYKDD